MPDKTPTAEIVLELMFASISRQVNQGYGRNIATVDSEYAKILSKPDGLSRACSWSGKLPPVSEKFLRRIKNVGLPRISQALKVINSHA